MKTYKPIQLPYYPPVCKNCGRGGMKQYYTDGFGTYLCVDCY